jgi:hypothetical protein
MKDWQEEFWATLEDATDAIEQFFQDVSQVAEELSEQLKNEIGINIEQFFEEFIEPAFEFDDDDEWFLAERLEEIEFPLNPKIDPSFQKNPACLGCRHYHGRVYGGNLLVCGMHPYGWSDRNCPDWEQE